MLDRSLLSHTPHVWEGISSLVRETPSSSSLTDLTDPGSVDRMQDKHLLSCKLSHASGPRLASGINFIVVEVPLTCGVYTNSQQKQLVDSN